MEFIIKSTRSEWEGMGYVSIHGDLDSMRKTGIGQAEKDFRDSYIILRNRDNHCECGAMVKALIPDIENYIEADQKLIEYLSITTGHHIEIISHNPVFARKIRITVSKTGLTESQMQQVIRTYLCRQSISKGQKKEIYLLTGNKITIGIVDVQPVDHSIFSNNTELEIDDSGISSNVIRLQDIGGLELEKKLIREKVLLPIMNSDFFSSQGIHPPRGLLLYGPPGCGKTMLAKALCGEINANLIELKGSEIFNSMYGESEKAIKDKFRIAKEGSKPSIILIDEIDALGSARTGMKGDLERRLVTTLLIEMDNLQSSSQVLVVATTNNREILDSSLPRPGRFDYIIQIGVPDKKGRHEILGYQTRHMRISKEVDMWEVAAKTHGYTGADLMQLCRESVFEAHNRKCMENEMRDSNDTSLSGLTIRMVDFNNAIKRVQPSALREFAIEVPSNLSWKDIGGHSGIKDTLMQEIIKILKDPESFESIGIKPIKGILLYGPPGTGKTLIARVLANEAEANFISVKGPEVLSKWVGESELRIRKIFEKAREASPCIIFFDEIDAISTIRGKSVNDSTDRIVNQLLTEMDGFGSGKHVCVIAATNRAELIDPALLRPGRFDYQLLMPLPDKEGREEIFKIHLNTYPVSEDIDLKVLVTVSDMFSGAHIADVCRKAAIAALTENNFIPSGIKIKMNHLMDTIEKVKRNIKEVERPKIGYNKE